MELPTRADLARLDAIARRAMLARGLEPDFPPAALAEVAALAGPANAADGPLADLRGLPWASIDNDDSRDLDQLTVAEPLSDGAARVLVAIADVDVLVRRDSALDRHAAHNTTSVYTAAEVFPMLPLALSTDLTSLGEGQDRVALVVELVVDGDGAVTRSRISRARVRNQAKLAYRGVSAWLEGQGATPPALARAPGMDAQMRLQDAVAQRLGARRHEHGALSLETTETRPVFSDGQLLDFAPEPKGRARVLIENLMIAANTATAQFLRERGFPVLRRVVRAPARWERIVALAAGLGEPLPPAPDAPALEGFLARRRAADPEGFGELSLAIVKLIGSGEYAVERGGHPVAEHFGLAVRSYTHATAPNRRYPDLVTQRLLAAALAGAPPPYAAAALEEVARRCTRKEDDARKVERQVDKSAVALLLAHRVGERFAAVVTGASPKGTWVRIRHPTVEGKLVQGAEGLDVGDRVRVALLAVDVERGFVDFRRAAD